MRNKAVKSQGLNGMLSLSTTLQGKYYWFYFISEETKLEERS
jgi:hypothetical protein